MDVDVDVDEDVDVDREDEAGCMQLSALTLRTHCPAAEGPSSQGASVCHQCAISVQLVCLSVPFFLTNSYLDSRHCTVVRCINRGRYENVKKWENLRNCISSKFVVHLTLSMYRC